MSRKVFSQQLTMSTDEIAIIGRDVLGQSLMSVKQKVEEELDHLGLVPSKRFITVVYEAIVEVEDD